ncbi:hypothetical protein JCM18899A_42790 [Nocardioides sp. AN3]
MLFRRGRGRPPPERIELNEQIAKRFHRRGISPEVARLFPSVAGGRDSELAELAADWESLLEREAALYREILGVGVEIE